jgi:hypothetical protein
MRTSLLFKKTKINKIGKKVGYNGRKTSTKVGKEATHGGARPRSEVAKISLIFQWILLIFTLFHL